MLLRFAGNYSSKHDQQIQVTEISSILAMESYHLTGPVNVCGIKSKGQWTLGPIR